MNHSNLYSTSAHGSIERCNWENRAINHSSLSIHDFHSVLSKPVYVRPSGGVCATAGFTRTQGSRSQVRWRLLLLHAHLCLDTYDASTAVRRLPQVYIHDLVGTASQVTPDESSDTAWKTIVFEEFVNAFIYLFHFFLFCSINVRFVHVAIYSESRVISVMVFCSRGGVRNNQILAGPYSVENKGVKLNNFFRFSVMNTFFSSFILFFSCI